MAIQTQLGSRFLDALSYLPYFKGKGKLVFAAMRWLGRETPLTMRLPNGARIILPNDRAVRIVMIYCIGKYEREFTRLFLQFLGRLKPGDCFVDLGANVGYYTMMAAWHLRRFAGSKVFAFEPNEKAFGYLEQNKRLNNLDNLILAPQAVGDCAGQMALHLDPESSLQSSLRPYLPRLVERREVPVTTLDAFLAEHGPANVKLMKMDIEGAELLALRGARETIARCRPVIFYEENPRSYAAFGYRPEDVRDFLEGLGYHLRLMKPTEVQNIVAIPQPDGA